MAFAKLTIFLALALCAFAIESDLLSVKVTVDRTNMNATERTDAINAMLYSWKHASGSANRAKFLADQFGSNHTTYLWYVTVSEEALYHSATSFITLKVRDGLIVKRFTLLSANRTR